MPEPISALSTILGLANSLVDLFKKIPQQGRYIVATLCAVALLFAIGIKGGYIQVKGPPQRPAEIPERKSEINETQTQDKEIPKQSAPRQSQDKSRPTAGQKGKKNQQQVLSGGSDNQQTQIGTGATVIQGSEGGCTQNVIGGSYNTNNCGPRPIRMSDTQEHAIALSLAANPSLHGQQVIIQCEIDVDDYQDLISKLNGALNEASIRAQVNYAGQFWIPDSPRYSGISLAYVWDGNRLLADSIDISLQRAGIVDKPVKRLNMTGIPVNPPLLTIIIRRP